MIENIRDWKVIILTLTFAPFFVILMHSYFDASPTIFRLLVINHDQGDSSNKAINAGEALISQLKQLKSTKNAPLLKVEKATALSLAKKKIMNKTADLLLIIPPRFTTALLEYKRSGSSLPVEVKTFGDPANPQYLMAAIWSDMTTYQYIETFTGTKNPIILNPQTIGKQRKITDFDLYVPGLLGLAVMMLMFTAAATIIKEKDKGTLIRLRLSTITTFEWLLAVSLSQLIIGLLTIGLTYLTSMWLGFQSSFALIPFLVISLLSCLSIIAVSLVVAAFLRTIFDLMTIGCFPFFILMFFSGGMFPLPQIKAFSLGSRIIFVNDILPTTHTIRALNKILNFNAGFADVAFEAALILLLTIVFFGLGLWFFHRRHLQAR